MAKLNLSKCHDPMCIDSPTCFAAFRHKGVIYCTCLSDTDFENKHKWCPFYKTTEEVLKEDPHFFERIDRPWLKIKD